MRMKEGSGNVVLQLCEGHHQSVGDQVLPPHNRPVPLEFAQLCQAKLVGEVPSLVPLLVVLVFVQSQLVTGVLILICLEVILHPCKTSTQNFQSAQL